VAKRERSRRPRSCRVCCLCSKASTSLARHVASAGARGPTLPEKVRRQGISISWLVLNSRMPAESSTAKLITSEVDPDLGLVKRFIKQMIAEGSIAVLLASILALLARMRDLNSELRRQLANARRRCPPNETLRRLQMELPFWEKPPANDASGEEPKKTRKKRGPRAPHPHGRPELPAHLPRVVDPRLVAAAERIVIAKPSTSPTTSARSLAFSPLASSCARSTCRS
jgi:hypothetical protein